MSNFTTQTGGAVSGPAQYDRQDDCAAILGLFESKLIQDEAANMQAMERLARILLNVEENRRTITSLDRRIAALAARRGLSGADAASAQGEPVLQSLMNERDTLCDAVENMVMQAETCQICIQQTEERCLRMRAKLRTLANGANSGKQFLSSVRSFFAH